MRKGRSRMELHAKFAFVRENASEEAIAEFIQGTLKELAVMACFIAMTPERKRKIEEAITLLEGCAGLYHRGAPIQWPAAANNR